MPPPPEKSPPVVKFGCPSTRSAVLAPPGKRRTRLLPPSATHRFPCASMVTPPPPESIEAKHREEAVGSGVGLKGVPVKFGLLPAKSTCPHTSSAIVSVVNGLMYFRTRWLLISGT